MSCTDWPWKPFMVMATLALSLGAPAALACSPSFPNRFLTEGEEVILLMPDASFRHELARLAPEPPPFRASAPVRDTFAATTKADLEDLATALEDTQLSASDRTLILDKHRFFRKLLQKHAMARYCSGQGWFGRKGQFGRMACEWDQDDPDPADLMTSVVPAGLPEEFLLYTLGAVAFHQDRLADACAAWQAVLELPAGEREFRSTWAAYMLGRAWLHQDPVQAIPWFARVRSLAEQGFSDSLGLAADSLGWEARFELDRGRCQRAIELYLQQFAAGDANVAISLRDVAALVVLGGSWPAVADQLSRRVVTAYLLSYRVFHHPEDLQQWLQAVEQAGAGELAGADRLAWLSYQAGDMDGARRWLDLAPGDQPIARWLEVKLLLRAGRLDQAKALLATLVRSDQPGRPNAGDMEAPYPFMEQYPGWSDPRYTEPFDVTAGDLGVLHLAAGEFTEALDAFLRSGSWHDAAYVAERVLTPAELIAFVDSYQPPPAPGDLGWMWGRPEDFRVGLRHLLARRLARLGRWSEAQAYFPPEFGWLAEAITEHLARGRTAARSQPQRAADLWQAAQLQSQAGLDLLGTEVEPDWVVYQGSYSDTAMSAARKGTTRSVYGATGEELERLRQHQVEPKKRYHYRYCTAELAWEAAGMMPDNSPRTAEVLCVAGSWLKHRDPEAADRFYKALVRRCRQTQLGQEAERRKWFPQCQARLP